MTAQYITASGLVEPDMEKESCTTRMVMSMKANGPIIREMAMEYSASKIEVSTKESGRTTK